MTTRPALALRSALASVALVCCTASLSAQGPTRATLRSEMKINGSAPSIEFTMILSVLPLRDGSIVVAEPREYRLRHFSEDGARQRTFGRDGSGPGEYRLIHLVGAKGDSIWVTDIRLRRTTWLSVDGALFGTEQWDLEQATPGLSRHNILGYLSTGAAFGELSLRAEATGDESAPRRIRLLGTGSAGGTREIVEIPAQHTTFRVMDGPTINFGRQPFQDAPIVSAGVGTDRIVVVDRRVMVTSSARAFSVTAIESNGDTAWRRLIPYVPLRVDKSVKDSIVRRTQASLSRSGASESVIRAALHLPDTRPPVSDAFVADGGAVWIRREENESSVTYLRVTADGRLDLETSVPRALRLVAARGTKVWGIELDADRVPSIVRFAIERSRPSTR